MCGMAMSMKDELWLPRRPSTLYSGGLPECAKHVSVTCADDTTMNEDKQGLQRDVTEVDVSRRGAGRTCLMIVTRSCRMIRVSGWN